MDDSHLLQAARYIELNPVRAGLVERPEDYPWSSAAANMLNRTDRLIARPLLPRMVGDWSKFIKGNQETGSNANLSEIIRKHERGQRRLGQES